MKQDKAEKIIQRAERKAEKARQQVEIASQKAEKAALKEAERAERKAVKQTERATKKAEKIAQKADRAAQKAEKANMKAEEKRAKIAAAAASAALEGAGEFDGEGGGKKGKKKLLLLILLPVVALAVAAGVFFFLKPKNEEPPPAEPIATPSEYVFEEVKVPALPVWGDEVLVYAYPVEAEPELDENGEPVEPDKDAFPTTDYVYQNLQSPRSLAQAYANLLTTEDGGFFTVDESFQKTETADLSGVTSVLLARNAPRPEGDDDAPRRVQTLLLSWDGQSCTVRVDLPEGRVKDPPPPPGSSGESEGGITYMIESLRDLPPSALGLEGESMDEYRIYTQDGTARVDGKPCLRINVYRSGGNNQIVGSYFLSTDGTHLYRYDPSTNDVTELDIQDALQ